MRKQKRFSLLITLILIMIANFQITNMDNSLLEYSNFGCSSCNNEKFKNYYTSVLYIKKGVQLKNINLFKWKNNKNFDIM